VHQAVVVVVFTITPRDDAPVDEYAETSAKMVELVSAMPGFLGMDYGESEGREVLVARFESHEAVRMWRDQPDHVVAQQLGRERFFAHYRIEVCELVRAYEFSAAESAQA
jgi:heme-degrading monooxygenase HmoA